MTDLTEQWKKGELQSGYYYVKNEFGNIFPSDYSENYDYISDKVIKDFFTEVSEIKEVIAPVPSYEKWEKFRNALADNQIENSSLLIENIKLKELLKRVNEHFGWIDRVEPFYIEEELWDDIKKALGEDK